MSYSSIKFSFEQVNSYSQNNSKHNYNEVFVVKLASDCENTLNVIEHDRLQLKEFSS